MRERGSISEIRPSGWHSVTYDVVEGGSLYNRCHLIAHELCGVNADERNLITGTRYLNVDGMLPFENRVTSYIVSTGNHVLYRVTPLYQGSDLVARGVQMEALSVEDGGAGIRFNVFAYNVSPGSASTTPPGPAGAPAKLSKGPWAQAWWAQPRWKRHLVRVPGLVGRGAGPQRAGH